MSFQYLITSFVIVVSPGAGALYTIATGLSRGFGRSVAAAIGCTVGILPHLAMAIAGLAAMLHTSALVFETFKYLGVVYLLYMAWHTLRERGALQVDNEATGERSVLRVAGTAMLVNTLNPKLSIFFLAFLPQFVPADTESTVPQMIELSAVFMLMTVIVFTGYGLFAAALRDHVISRPRVLAWMRRTFAGAFVGIGIQLALAEH